MIYFISDTHFNHQNCLKFIGREQFKTVEEMNKTIIDNWNSTIFSNDTVYHLGDVFLSDAPKAREIIGQLKGHKILIRGNHDDKPDQWYLNAGFEEVHRVLTLPSPTMPGRMTYIITHIPLPYTQIESLEGMYGHKVINLHGHLHAVTDRSFTGDDVWEHPDSYINFSVEKTKFIPVKVEL